MLIKEDTKLYYNLCIFKSYLHILEWSKNEYINYQIPVYPLENFEIITYACIPKISQPASRCQQVLWSAMRESEAQMDGGHCSSK